MPLVPIDNVGQVGIIQDIPPYNLPPNAWSGGNNVRFLDSGVGKCAGYEETMATCPFAPYYIHPYLSAGEVYYWIAYGATDIAVWNGSTWTDVTRQSTGTLDGGINNSVTTIVLTDASDFPTSGKIAMGSKAIADGSADGYEEVSYSGKSSNDLTGCSRGYNSTTPAPHTTGYVVTPILDTLTTDDDYGANKKKRKWTHTDLNGIVVATNGYDAPQMWPLSGGIPSLTTPFVQLQNWPSADTKADIIRSFRTFLVGLNFDRASQEPRLVKWSTEATYGQPPSTWSETDNTLDAGEYQLADTPGPIIEGLAFGDSFLIYKTDAIYVMNYVGTPYIFSFKLLSPTIGCLAKNAVAEFEGGHFFIGNSDFYICNGQQVTPLLPERLRRTVFDDLNATDDQYLECFVTADHVRNEMLACYPSGSSTVPNRAVIWNWKTNTFSFRDLPDTLHINSGIVEITTGLTWATISGSWDAGSGAWGSTNYDNVAETITFADVTNTKIYRDGRGNTEDGTDMTAYIQRTGYDLQDPQLVKFVSAVYPKMEVSGDNSVDVYVGHQMSTEDGVTWEGPTSFNPNSQSKVSCRVTGKYFGIKVASSGDFDWKLNGVAFEVKPRGKRGGRSY